MRTINFAKRNFKEIIRDPISVIFAVMLPLFLLYIFQQFKIPSQAYKLINFTPGVIIFSFSFLTLFTAMLVSKDRTTSLLIRLGVSPMRPIEYIIGYIMSLIPIVVMQSILIFILAVILGLDLSINIIFAILVSIPISILFIGLGILIGSLFSEKASSSISSIVIQLVCFTSGMYFEKELLGSTFSKICDALPFESSLIIIKGILNDINMISTKNIILFVIYLLVILLFSSFSFKRKMISDDK